jgi:hypothetical protein
MWNFSRGISRTVADKKPIRWFVPQGGESFMGIAAYYLTHEENMRQSFSQPSRSITRMLPDGTRIDYIMNDVVDCIRISPPQRAVSGRDLGKTMTWDKLPPFEEGIDNIDFSLMTEDPLVEGGYYCTVSVINGTDENGRTLSATFSVKMSTGSVGWSIEQGVRQDDGTYKVDGKSATLLLREDVEGECDIVATDGKTTLTKTVNVVRYSYYMTSESSVVREPATLYHWYPWFVHEQGVDGFVPYWLLNTVITTTTSTYSIYGPDDILIDAFTITGIVTEYATAFSSLIEEYTSSVSDFYGAGLGSITVIAGDAISDFVQDSPFFKRYSYTLTSSNGSAVGHSDMYEYWRSSSLGMYLEPINAPYNDISIVSDRIEVDDE